MAALSGAREGNPRMIMQPVTSSNVEAVGYDADARLLFVSFKSGAQWIYSGITPLMHKTLMEAESIGSHLRKTLIPAAISATKAAA